MMADVYTDLEDHLTIEEDLAGLRSQQTDRERLVSLVRENNAHFKTLFGSVKPFEINASCKPFSCLKRVALDDLLVNSRSVNSYLIFRCVFAHVSNIREAILIAEDHQGSTSACLIYNHVFMSKMEEEFSLETVFVVKEPFLKQCKDKNQVLVVNNPTDLVKVTRHHNLFQETVLWGWSDTSKDPVTAQGWKNVGLYAARLEKYDVAIEAYVMGLKLNPEFEARWKLHLNLVLTYYKIGFFELCLEHASLVLEMQPRNQKSLFHAGLSHYELRQYESAKHYFERLLQVNPSHQNAILEITRCRERIVEQRGCINIFDLYEKNQTNTSDCIDFGDFVGPIKIASVVGKEPSFVAKDDIIAGTLVLAEKAIVSDMVENSREIYGQKYTEIGGLLAKTLQIIYKNPVTFEKLLSLSCKSPHREKEIILFCNGEEKSEICLDVPRILSILWTNFLALRSRYAGAKHDLLYYYSSFVNHSCIPNCSLFTYNDVMLIRTATLVRKGEEITVAYKVNLSPRLEGLSIRGSICNCNYCDIELKESREVKERRMRLLQEFSTTRTGLFGNTQELRRIISELERTYEGREKFTTALFHPYLKLADAQNGLSGGSKSQFMHLANKALNCLGLSTEDLLSCGSDESAYLPRDAMVTDEDLLYEAAMTIMFSQTQRSEIEKWFKVLLMLERLFAGGDLRMLRRKFPQVEFILSRVSL